MLPIPPLSFTGGGSRSGDAGTGSAVDQGAGSWNVTLGGSGGPVNGGGSVPPMLMWAAIGLAVWFVWKHR